MSGRKEDGEIVTEAALDSVVQVYEHYDVKRIVGVSIVLVIEDERGKTQMTTNVVWTPSED